MSANLIEKTSSAHSYPLLIKQLLVTPLATRPGQVIVNAAGERYTYRDLHARIGRLASGLASLGVEPGDTVGVMDWDTRRYLEAYFAVPMMGAVLHTINVRLAAEQLLYTIEHAEDKVILVNKDFLPLLESIRGRLSTVRKYVLISDDGARPADGSQGVPIEVEYEEMLDAASLNYDFPDLDEDTRATTFYTTGTTGLPKGVYFSHRQIVLHTLGSLVSLEAPARGQRVHRDDVYMPLTPMFHVHAWGLPYMATLLGLKQVYPGRYQAEVILRLITQEGVTLSHGVPTVLHMVLSSPAGEGVDLGKWKVIIGGSALPKGLARAALARGIDVFAGYGMSETCPILTLAQVPSGQEDLGIDQQVEMRTRTGQPIALVDLHIMDDDMGDLPHDGESLGEVTVRAPWLTQGYYKDMSNSENLWRGGYLHTADVGHIAADGFLQITDRMKDMIKSGGEWISSLEVEDIISQHPAVSEVAVIGIADEKWGERPMAIVVLRPGKAGTVTPNDISEHVRGFAEKGVVSSWARPDYVVFVDALDKTSVGKLDKKLLRTKFGLRRRP